MTSTLSEQPARTRRSPRQRERPAPGANRSRPHGARATHQRLRGSRALARYVDQGGGRREVVARTAIGGSVLVIDRDAETLGDRRLLAHLGPDEPRENAAVVCRLYLEDGGLSVCRRVTAEDSRRSPLPDERLAGRWDREQEVRADELLDRGGRMYRLELVDGLMSIPELRWKRIGQCGIEARSVSVRDVVGALERYEPVRTLTQTALAQHTSDPCVSVTVVRAELQRVLTSSIVLNRALRDAVLAKVRREGLSMSEIALRCGRVKRDSKGNESGETSWLARRLGVLPEGGHLSPTPWVHTEVLALVARRGLGISPREVEL
jgi:hypothetical protein